MVDLAPLCELFAVYFQDLLMSVSETHHLLATVIVQRSIKALKVFDLGVSFVLLADQRGRLPSAVRIRQIDPLDEVDGIDTLDTLHEHIEDDFTVEHCILQDLIHRLRLFKQPVKALFVCSDSLLPRAQIREQIDTQNELAGQSCLLHLFLLVHRLCFFINIEGRY